MRDADVGRVHAADPARLAESVGSNLAELEGTLAAQAGDGQVIDSRRNHDAFDLAEFLDLAGARVRDTTVGNPIEDLVAHRERLGEEPEGSAAHGHAASQMVSPRHAGIPL